MVEVLRAVVRLGRVDAGARIGTARREVDPLIAGTEHGVKIASPARLEMIIVNSLEGLIGTVGKAEGAGARQCEAPMAVLDRPQEAWIDRTPILADLRDAQVPARFKVAL